MRPDERTLEKFSMLFETCFYLGEGLIFAWSVRNKARLSSSANEAEEKGAMETNELRY